MTAIECGPTGLNTKTVAAMQQVFEQFSGVSRVVLFGSRALGTYKPGSDIDLAIEGDIDFQALNALEVALDDLMLPYEMDLIIRAEINNPDLEAHIERVGQVFFKRS